MKRLLPVALLPLLAPCAFAAEPPNKPEAQVQHQIVEDSQVRIEETRFRGQTQSIVVKSKIRGIRPSEYEVAPPTAARDPSVAGPPAGQARWHFLSF